MSEDNPPPSQNPFIRFKNHVDSRISNGISFITGNHPPATHQQQQPQQQEHNPASHYNMSFGGPPFGGGGPPFGGGNLRVSFWNEWTQLSPYSPYNLRHLRQPVPTDLPAGVDAKSFGFEDAFEDLLAVSAGRPMMDLTRQARMKKDILDHLGFNEPPINWARRLAHDGLLPQPLPPSRPPGFGPPRISVADSLRKLSDPALFEEGLKELDRTLHKVRGPSHPESSWFRQWEIFKKEVGNDPPAFLNMLIDKSTENARKALERINQDSEKWLSRQRSRQEDVERIRRPLEQDPWGVEQHRQQGQQQQQPPSTEADLFDFIRSTVEQVDKSFHDFTKSFVESASKPVNEDAAAPAEAPLPFGNNGNGPPTSTRTEETDESGCKTTRYEIQWVDRAGRLHQDVEIVRVDANGRLLGRENTSQVTFQTPSTTTSTPASSSEQQTTSSNSDDGKPTGWFWKNNNGK